MVGCVVGWGTRPSRVPDGPAFVSHLDAQHETVLGASCNALTTICVTNKGLYSWGSLHDIQAPNHTSSSSAHMSQLDDPIIEVSCGWGYLAVCTSSGAVLVAGSNSCMTSQLASSKGGKVDILDFASIQSHPVILRPISNLHVSSSSSFATTLIIHICAAEHHILMLSASGEVFAAGMNSNGQLGVGDTWARTGAVRVRVGSPDARITRIACGGRHSMAVDHAGITYSWGWGGYLQLGLGGTDDEHTPRVITSLLERGISVQDVSCGYWHSAVLSTRGVVYTFGWGMHGALAQGAKKGRPFPTRVRFFPASPKRNDEDSDGEGDGDDGDDEDDGEGPSLASGSMGHSNNEVDDGPPIPPPSTTGDSSIAHVSCGGKHTLFLTLSGRVYVSGTCLVAQQQAGLDAPVTEEHLWPVELPVPALQSSTDPTRTLRPERIVAAAYTSLAIMG
eukprot:TRINITY_DN8345_c0_g1_i3.p1 TRINITY_DN8345_c0_g1~~TRINITY_DN8345_c0_g1_i3.p1  ORF type:complete len:448 (-),score=85.72 TRINITY_DN8345_c0_g1_i3:182-1525(-)